MLELANFYLGMNKPERSDYASEYEKLLQSVNLDNAPISKKENILPKQPAPTDNNLETNKEDTVKKLKEYRLKQSRAERIKPYYIFNDAQMEDLLNKKPRTKEDLLKVSGFGKVKVEKYGEDIIKILSSSC